jgi:DNA invertase Pin-like site-specific DNA recombinase
MSLDSNTPVIAYSYVRFSTPEQLKGDSLRRQTEAALAWCQRNQARLDTTLALHDLGKSAYTGAHRKNPDRNALAAFLKLVEQDRVTRGSYLIVESLDRLTREHIRPALTLLLNLIEAGIRIVQLSPVEVVFDENVEPMGLMMALMELSRGNSESRMKSERNGKSWQAKLAAARQRQKQPARRQDGRLTRSLTDRLPAWVEDRSGELALIQERAAAVRQIFELAAAGYGVAATIKRLLAEGVKPFGSRQVVVNADGEPEETVARGKTRPKYQAGSGGRYGAGTWNRAYVGLILKDRRALGEYQPCGKGRKPEGEPIQGYFPAVVTEQQWLAARAGAAERRTHRGRNGKHINLFAGLLRHATDGDSLYVDKKVLVNTAGVEGRAAFVSFPAETFERAVLTWLREIDPKSILAGANGHDVLTAVEDEFGQVERSIAALLADLDANGDSPLVLARLRAKEQRRAELAKLLEAARQKAANPLSASWGEAKTLLDALGSAPDPEDARLRLRSALRRIIDSIWVVIVRHGLIRLAAVQVFFHGGSCPNLYRTYFIAHKQALGGAVSKRPARWYSHSLAQPEGLRVGASFDMMDLRHKSYSTNPFNPDEEVPGANEIRASLLTWPKKWLDDILAEHGQDVA